MPDFAPGAPLLMMIDGELVAGDATLSVIDPTVWIDKHGDISAETPFAGAKLSGVGVEIAAQGLHGLTQIKVMNCAKPPAAASLPVSAAG